MFVTFNAFICLVFVLNWFSKSRGRNSCFCRYIYQITQAVGKEPDFILYYIIKMCSFYRAYGCHELIKLNLYYETRKMLLNTHISSFTWHCLYIIMFTLPVVKDRLSWQSTNCSGRLMQVSLYCYSIMSTTTILLPVSEWIHQYS